MVCSSMHQSPILEDVKKLRFVNFLLNEYWIGLDWSGGTPFNEMPSLWRSSQRTASQVWQGQPDGLFQSNDTAHYTPVAVEHGIVEI